MKVINLVFKKEYGKKIKFKDIKKEMFFNEDTDLEEDEKRIDYPFNDFYFLYYYFDKKTRKIKVLDIYSMPFAGLINDNLENEIKGFIISDLIYNDIIKNMKKGYSFEDCLANEMFDF